MTHSQVSRGTSRVRGLPCIVTLAYISPEQEHSNELYYSNKQIVCLTMMPLPFLVTCQGPVCVIGIVCYQVLLTYKIDASRDMKITLCYQGFLLTRFCCSMVVKIHFAKPRSVLFMEKTWVCVMLFCSTHNLFSFFLFSPTLFLSKNRVIKRRSNLFI